MAATISVPGSAARCFMSGDIGGSHALVTMSAGYEWVWFGASFGRRSYWADILTTLLLVSPTLVAVFALITVMTSA